MSDALPIATPESVGVSSDRLQNQKKVLQRYIDAELLAGTCSLVARDGKVIHFESQGWRNIEAKDAMTDDTIFHIMSVTKTVVVSALMMLYEEGHFLLTDPITNFIPEIADKKVQVRDDKGGVKLVDAKRPIDFRHIMTQNAGVDPIVDLLSDDEKELLKKRHTLEETILAWAPLPLGFHPGDAYNYGSSIDYVAFLVERISGMRLADFLQERMFGPLGMIDTSYAVPKGKLDRVSAVYKPIEPDMKLEVFRSPDYAVEPVSGGEYHGGWAGIFSTTADMWRFTQMLANGGELDGVRLLSPKTINVMISKHSDYPLPAWGRGFKSGLGCGVLVDAGKARLPMTPGAFSHRGGWGTGIWVDPAERMVGVFMAQLTDYAHIPFRDLSEITAILSITESYLGNVNKPPLIQAYPIIA